jgi:uncharacterized protein DUF3617
MMRWRLAFGVSVAALALSCVAAGADELPLRKPGLWEMKVIKVGSQLPTVTMQHCTDATTDKDMADSVSPLIKRVCTKQDVVKTAAGYVSDSVCTFAGTAVTSHSEIVGDFNSAYTVTTKAHLDKGPDSVRDTTTQIEAKWLGACKPDQKPGDVIMPGGIKMNIKDGGKLEKLKDLFHKKD